jgi:putative FmdB family regulatory protein
MDARDASLASRVLESESQKNGEPRVPLYEYECRKCHHRFEKIEKNDAPEVRKCPKCGSKADRQISGAAIQFKGAGWYVTDYGGKKGGDPKSEKSSSSEKSEKADKSEKNDKIEKTEKKEAKTDKSTTKSKEK